MNMTVARPQPHVSRPPNKANLIAATAFGVAAIGMSLAAEGGFGWLYASLAIGMLVRTIGARALSITFSDRGVRWNRGWQRGHASWSEIEALEVYRPSQWTWGYFRLRLAGGRRAVPLRWTRTSATAADRELIRAALRWCRYARIPVHRGREDQTLP